MIFTDTSSRSRKARTLVPLLALALLGGCARIPLPDIVFDDGPAPATAANVGDADPVRALTGERPIRRADPRMPGEANLASVPARPESFSSPIERQALLDRLQVDRDEGTTTGEGLRAQQAAPQPPAVDIPTLPEAPPPVPDALPRPPDTNPNP